jgi:hypothetical protein
MDTVLFDLAFNEFRDDEMSRDPDAYVEFFGYLPKHTSHVQIFALMMSGAKIDYMEEGTWAIVPKGCAVHWAILANYPSATNHGRWNA